MDSYIFFDSQFSIESALKGDYDSEAVKTGFANIDEFEKDLVANYGSIAKMVMNLDVPEKKTSKKQKARERLDRLTAMCASQNRTLFEEKQKKRRKPRLYKKPQCTGYFAKPTAQAPLVKLKLEDLNSK
ncbi:unnamed protein product [Auanema sp. JU1783]|nr:unnamed protein product [Auanema sp. JU1783]